MIKQRLTQANILKFAAMAIAAPRYCGAFAAALGLVALTDYPWLADLEVLSGGAMALLEGFAMAFVLGKWRMLRPGSLYWSVLLSFVSLLAVTLPLVATPYLLSAQNDLSTHELFVGYVWLQILWSALVAGVPVLVIMAVGVADVDERERELTLAATHVELEQVKEQANVTLSKPNVTCEYCQRAFKGKRGLASHRAYCQRNPKRNVEHAPSSAELTSSNVKLTPRNAQVTSSITSSNGELTQGSLLDVEANRE